MRPHGFTLLEVLIVAALLAVVFLLGLTALQSSGASVNLSRAQALVQQDVRAVLNEMAHELEMAAKTTRDDRKGVEGLRIESPTPEEPNAEDIDLTVIRELVFQRPSNNDPNVWTSPIIYRFINEDTNKNGLLDPNESDLDFNDRATSVIQRLEDLNQDGLYDGPGEERIIGSAQTITDVQFTFDGDMLTVMVEATRVIPGTVSAKSGSELSSRTVQCTQTSTIYPLN